MKVFILTRKRLLTLGAVAVVLCFGCLVRIFGDDAVAVTSSAQERSIPIYCVDDNDNRVSISFDAAWGNEQTESLLDTLEEYDVTATFFLVGDWVRNYPDDVKAIYDAGHDVGNHSDTHPYMTQLDTASMKSEIDNCNSEIEAITGECPTLFRAPYGDYDNTVVDTVTGMGMYCVQWDVDTLDWEGLSAEEMCERVRNNVQSGSIILMHNGGENTPEALPMIIECLRELGYEIVPISELLLDGDYTTDYEGRMCAVTSDTDTQDADSESTRQTAAEVDAASQLADDTSTGETVSAANGGASDSSATMSSATSSIGKKK